MRRLYSRTTPRSLPQPDTLPKLPVWVPDYSTHCIQRKRFVYLLLNADALKFQADGELSAGIGRDTNNGFGRAGRLQAAASVNRRRPCHARPSVKKRRRPKAPPGLMRNIYFWMQVSAVSLVHSSRPVNTGSSTFSPLI